MINKNKIQKIKKENNSLDLLNYEPLIDELSKILENQKISKKKQDQILETTQRGFIGLALRNEELLKVNKELKEQLDIVVGELNQIKEERHQLRILQEQLEVISDELHDKRKEEKILQEKKDKRKNRKRLPRREPITTEIYSFLVKQTEAVDYRNRYRAARLRLALALLAITGIRISELLPLKMIQIKTLFTESWIAIDRSKRGPSSHKAFLTREGINLIRDRAKDFEFLLHFKNENSYIFTSEYSNKPLERESFTNIINQFLRDSAKQMEGQPKLTSHSFRIGFITQLWRDTSDIEFVKQTVGHARIITTSLYVEHLSDEERKNRIKTISSPRELIIEPEEFF